MGTLKEHGKSIRRIFKLPKTVYHYTSIQALYDGLINKDGVSLWLSHCRFLNDQTEYHWGKSFAEYILSLCELPTTLLSIDANMPYVLSFSKKRDFLPMWSMYGKNGNGVMLEFDSDLISPCFGDLYSTSNCIYTTNEFKVHNQSKRIEKLIKDFKQAKASGQSYNEGLFAACMNELNHLQAVIKSDYYSYEQEVRIVHNPKPEDIKYRPSGNIYIPYTEKLLSKESLKSIWIGPNQDKERTILSLELYLQSNGYKPTLIKVSDAPYRG